MIFMSLYSLRVFMAHREVAFGLEDDGSDPLRKNSQQGTGTSNLPLDKDQSLSDSSQNAPESKLNLGLQTGRPTTPKI